MSMKRWITYLLVALMLLGLCGCTEQETVRQNDQNESEQTTSSFSEMTDPTEGATDRTTDPTKSEETIPPTEELEEPNEVPPLSESCNKILASGHDAEGNCFELVANETEDYNGTTIEMGIIKNNEWAIHLTSDCPFVDESGLLVGARGNFKGSIYEEEFAVFYYIGAGCFIYDNLNWENRIIWNGNTGGTYLGSQNDGYTPVTKGTKPYVNNDGIFVLEGYDKKVKFLDVNTMSITETELDCGSRRYCFPYSEGLFAFMNESYDDDQNGFYDINGNKIIDLGQYRMAGLTYEISYDECGPQQDLVFENGTCSFKIINDQGSIYYITIDKTGKVIASQKKY